MIDYVSSMKQAMTDKIMADCIIDSLGRRIVSVAEGYLRGHVNEKEYRIGDHMYKAAHTACSFDSYGCERGKDPITLKVLLYKVGATQLEKKRAYKTGRYFSTQKWYMVWDKEKEDAYKYRAFTVSVEDAITGNYNLRM